jgi:hypothetical protein
MHEEPNSSEATAPTSGGGVPLPWLSLEEARAALEKTLRGFLANLDRRDARGLCPALALRATVGLGKSRTLRELLAETAGDILQSGNILIFVPTHALAEEAEAAFQALGTGIPSMVLRGRDAKDPSSGKPMCEKSHLAGEIARVGWGVTSALCQAKDPGSGDFYQAPCRDGCAWFAQLPTDEHRIIFLPHAYLRSPLPRLVGSAVALRIIDEKFVGAITWTQAINFDDWLRPCSCTSPAAARAALCIHEARRVVIEALMRGDAIVPRLIAAGFSRSQMGVFAQQEKADQPELSVAPWMPCDDQKHAIDTFDWPTFFQARACARLWSMLDEDWPRGSSERICFAETPSAGDAVRTSITIHSCGTVLQDAPLIMLDADADPLITEALVPGAEFVSISAPPQAEVIQVEDQTFSNAALLSRTGSAARRREILGLVEQEAANGRRVLLVAARAVLRQLHLDEHPARAEIADDELLAPLRGAHPRWFGPGMQGVDKYKDFETVIIVGRLQPRIEAIESGMRSVFGNGEKPLRFMPADDPMRGWYAPVEGAYRLSDGNTKPAKSRSHPDPRGAAILALNREAYSIQAIGRIRAVNARKPKRILVLCSVPLPDLPIDQLALWQELVTGLPRDQLGEKFQRLEAALYPRGRSMPRSGLRLSGEGIRSDAPEAFSSASSGAEWRRDLATGTVFEMVRTIARRRGGRPQFVMLRRPGGGRRIPAVLFDQPGELSAAVARHWPGVELADIIEEPTGSAR